MIVYDTAVIGAGAAGLMTAIQCARQNLKTLLLDGREKIGAKILMSGGTRCNVTNDLVTERDFSSETPRTVRNVLRAYPPRVTLDFFNKLGVELVLEQDGKYWPSTNTAKTILNALVSETNHAGVDLKTAHKVLEVKHRDGAFTIVSQNSTFQSKTLVLATGGLSHPTTGSDGSGYTIAKHFGHSLVKPIPALTPLLTKDTQFQRLSGVALPARLSLWSKSQKQVEFVGAFLITHFGFSGPTTLNMSRYWLRAKQAGAATIRASFLPSSNEQKLRNELRSERERTPQKLLKTWLAKHVPERLALFLLQKSAIHAGQVLGQLTQKEQHTLMGNVFQYALPITDVFGFQKAEVTAGGVHLKEVSAQSLESRLQKGLYLVGEILDVDGHIGGYNFQWAWSSAQVAAASIAKQLQV